jgi:hypothetical protein
MTCDIVIKRCVHLQAKTEAHHADVVFTTLPPERNSTSYTFHDRIELCVFCSGILRGTLAGEPFTLKEVGRIKKDETTD